MLLFYVARSRPATEDAVASNSTLASASGSESVKQRRIRLNSQRLCAYRGYATCF